MGEEQWNRAYWDERWRNRQTGWDIGYASPAITDYVDQLEDKSMRILIPGCGNAYEGEYLLKKGFENTFLIDLSPEALNSLKRRVPEFPEDHLILGDFFEHSKKYDLIIEQTFFCAIPPYRRKEYADKASSLLNKNGKIIGLLFDKTFDQPGPPFGGCPCEYKPIFKDHFSIEKMEECYNSIPPRAGSELFIKLAKK